MVAGEFDMVNSETYLFYNRVTGEFDFYNEYMDMEDDDSEKYEDDMWIAAPSQRDLDEYSIMEDFIDTVLDSQKKELLSVAVEGRGAFRRFKDTLYRVDLVDEWYSFKHNAFVEIARQWCERHSIDYIGIKHSEHREDIEITGCNKNILETKRLILRPLTRDDFPDVHSWACNPINTRYMAWGPNTAEQTLEFLSLVKNGKDFAVVLKESTKVIGSCGIYPNNGNDTGEMGWILHMDHWKCGYGTEVCGELIRYGFEDLKLRRIFAPCAAVNYGSYRVMERNGMRREALHVRAFWARVDKEWIDETVYAILADEYF
jgi:RimJ/RimL family protein N-acetyltransferase